MPCTGPTEMSETYEAIGIAVRQHDAIRLTLMKGVQATYYISAESIRLLFGRRTVPLYRLRLTDDFVDPEPAGEASMSASGKSVLLRIWGAHGTVMVPTRPLQVHYERALGETTKIIRPAGAPTPTPGAACMAVA